MMFLPFPRFWTFRLPRRLRDTDRVRNAAFVLGGNVFAGMSWRSPT